MQTYGKAVLGCLLVAGLSSTALAKPLTKADIEGKKICWGDHFKIFGSHCISCWYGPSPAAAAIQGAGSRPAGMASRVRRQLR